jgi:opacity protein-like surface antigen
MKIAAALVLTVSVAAPAAAQQSFNVNLGYFSLRGDESRVAGDVLIADRFNNNLPLFFQTKDFNNVSLNGEWFVPIGDFIEAGAGVGFYRRTVPSVYETFTKPGGAEIAQDLKLRIVPITFAVRVMPFGRDAIVRPYVGAGVAVFNWRYSEVGEFIDASDNSIFSERFSAKGTDAGPIVMGGVVFPIGDSFATGGEVRYQKAEGSLPLDQFLGDRIDLGGFTYSWTMQFKFGRR